MIKTEIILTGILMFMIQGSLFAGEYFTDDTSYREAERDWEPFEKYLDSLSEEEYEQSMQESYKRIRDYYQQRAESLRIV